MKITSKILVFALAAILLIGGVSVPASAAADTYVVPLGKYSEIHPFSDGVAVVEDYDGKVGVIDTSGREIIPRGKYGYIYNFSDGVTWAAIWDNAEWNGGWRFGLIDKSGKEIIPPSNQFYSFESFSGGVTIAKYRDSRECVIIDTSGKVVVNLGNKYWGVQGISDGRAISTAFSDGLALMSDGDGYTIVIDTTGREIMRYDKDGDKSLDLSGFHDGVAVEHLKGDYSSSHATVAGVCVIDKTGKVIVPYGKYQSIRTFSDGMAVVEGFSGSYGVIDTTGKEVVPIGKYDSVTFEGLTLRGFIYTFSDGIAVVEYRDENWVQRVGVIDKTGKEIIPPSTKYTGIYPFNDGMAVVRTNSEATSPRGIIDKTGREILPPTDKYADIKSIYDGVAIVNVGGYWDAWIGSEVIGGQWGIIKIDTSSTSIPETPIGLVATPTASTVYVNVQSVAFDAYTINGNNYFKLRDLAYILSGTEKQFEVGWDGANNAISLTSGKAYTAVGGEMTGKGAGNKTPTPTSSKIYLDGKEVAFTAYTIDGNNYFKLRDIGLTFDFGVMWDGANNAIVIDTSVGYTPE